MAAWTPDRRFPLYLHHLIIFYLLISLITFGFCLAALVLAVQSYHDSTCANVDYTYYYVSDYYAAYKCSLGGIVDYAIAFPTSVIILIHSVVLLILTFRRSLSVLVLLFSCLAAAFFWIPTLVVGWSPTHISYTNSIVNETDFTGNYTTETPSYSYGVTGALDLSRWNFLQEWGNFDPLTQVVMGVIVLTSICL
jgi:hypothetical protein